MNSTRSICYHCTPGQPAITVHSGAQSAITVHSDGQFHYFQLEKKHKQNEYARMVNEKNRLDHMDRRPRKHDENRSPDTVVNTKRRAVSPVPSSRPESFPDLQPRKVHPDNPLYDLRKPDLAPGKSNQGQGLKVKQKSTVAGVRRKAVS